MRPRLLTLVAIMGVAAVTAAGIAKMSQPESAEHVALVVESASLTPAGSVGSSPRPRILIHPETSRVTVDGVLVAMESGSIALDRRPGEVADVTVTNGAATRSVRVFVTVDGRAEPDRIDLVSQPALLGVSSAAIPPNETTLPVVRTASKSKSAPTAPLAATADTPPVPSDTTRPKNKLQDAVVEKPPF